MATSDELFRIYVQTYGKVKSGTKLTNTDYLHLSAKGSTPYATDERLAVSLGAQDVKDKIPMRSLSEFVAQMTRLKN